MPPLITVELLDHLLDFLSPVATLFGYDLCNKKAENWTLKMNKNDRLFTFDKTNRHIFTHERSLDCKRLLIASILDSRYCISLEGIMIRNEKLYLIVC